MNKHALNAIRNATTNMTLAQEAAKRLERIESTMRLTARLQERANDSDKSRHLAWRPARLDVRGTPSPAIVPIKLDDDSAGWVLQRLAVAVLGAAQVGHPCMVCLDKADLTGLAETFATAAGPDATGVAYADAFNNDIYVDARRTIFVVVPFDAGATQVIVNLQVQRLVRYAERTIADDYDLDVTPVTDPDSRDGNLSPVADGIDNVLRHETPEQFGPTDEVAGEEHTEEKIHAAAELLPNVAAHLPPRAPVIAGELDPGDT